MNNLHHDKHNQPTSDRPAEMDELFFDDDESAARVGDEVTSAEIERDQPAERVREAGLTEASMPGNERLGNEGIGNEGIGDEGLTADDASPATLIAEDGARSPEEVGDGVPADKDLSYVGADAIGGGRGLDEAELARAHPLDGEPWDGDEAEPLQSAQTTNENFATEAQTDLSDLDEDEEE